MLKQILRLLTHIFIAQFGQASGDLWRMDKMTVSMFEKVETHNCVKSCWWLRGGETRDKNSVRKPSRMMMMGV